MATQTRLQTVNDIARALIVHVDQCEGYIDTGDILDYVESLRNALPETTLDTATCGVCEHKYSDHWTSNDTQWSGCAADTDAAYTCQCEGFAD